MGQDQVNRMLTKVVRVAVFIFAVMFSSISAGRVRNPAVQNGTSETPAYTESEAGFREQVNAVIRASCSGDATTAQRLLDRFSLPDATAWFAHNFDSDNAKKLAERYERLSSTHGAVLQKTIGEVCENPGSEVVVSHKDAPVKAQMILRGDQPSTVHPVVDLLLTRFHFQILRNGQPSVSWEEIFVYEQGAFRFLGKGAWPFWTREERPDSGNAKDGYFVHNGAPMYQIPPQYPLAARAQHLEGVVVFRAIIDKEGNVKKLDVLQGHPLLVDAARDAARQWRYTPSTMGGHPIEAETNITITFQLRQP
jgi:TonB family protein